MKKRIPIDLLRDTLSNLSHFDEIVGLSRQGKLSPEQEKAIEEAAEANLNLYVSLRDSYCEIMDEGNAEPVLIILNAIGPEALNLHWFIKGLKKLLNKGREVQLSIPELTHKDIKKELKFFSTMEHLEKRVKKGEPFTYAAALLGSPDEEEETRKRISKFKTQYYRDLPKKSQIYLFRKLHFSLFNYLLPEAPESH